MPNQYYLSKETAEQYIKLAKGYDGKFLIDLLKNYLPLKSKVLELGSGPGADLEILSQNYEVTGSDFSQYFLDILKKKKIKNPLILLDAITLKTSKTFDCIYSNKVLQHLTDNQLEQSIQNQLAILNKDGIICHSFWAGNDCYEMKGALHNYHTKDELENCLSPYFETLVLDFYNEMEKDDSILFIGKIHSTKCK
ncbi:MAG: methyltransferase domain-containing protein [Candidatus Marinimicrobia bacterium]|jgi:cyclopropane fatty-acyl-phospholipid synthase-like methyltransferase|nr:methyltransferase domain-containing protein [Candidatus Neomarinimicrobiota bacterium]MBT3502809.1 methyltransferase domain-containing protein [Candidatus Neomarinimicrobiota bacterium]MBT3839151.1 methyltransferase domain-containing protein [Candidatus Neomarinimicrobiota bacterium]MBT4000376.1 methyltransferase domain-containing protein [Candidatus Neomarinimicrobiota bacterium]MBT4283643.1 methyltransferase domain-containing protein [Candidatus Neomarinimicrobiota bacterium]